jgi:hypothetical protein
LNLIKIVAFIILFIVSSFSNATDRRKTTVSDINVSLNLTAEDVVNRIVRYTGVTWNDISGRGFSENIRGTSGQIHPGR